MTFVDGEVLISWRNEVVGLLGVKGSHRKKPRYLEDVTKFKFKKMRRMTNGFR